MASGEHRIRCYARIRPTWPKEVEELERQQQEPVIEVQNSQEIRLKTTGRVFDFDRVFDATTAQKEVFDTTSKELIDHALKGYCGTLFVYGQTGTGKTYTITGPPASEGRSAASDGVVPRAMDYLYSQIENDPTYSLSFNFIQLYRDNVEDLMTADAKRMNGKTVEIKLNRIDLLENVRLDGLKDITTTPAATQDEFFQKYAFGCGNRAIAETKMNAHSSRGHTLLVLHIRKHQAHHAEGEVSTLDPSQIEAARDLKGQLIFADLAGYERMKKTEVDNKSIHKDEAASINTSLMALSKVVSSLTKQRQQHISWRDSRLTRILQDSLTGNSITSIIVTMNCLPFHLTETLSSLHFGSAAMKVTTKTRIVYGNQADFKKHYILLQTQYKTLLLDKERLEAENKELKLRDTSAETSTATPPSPSPPTPTKHEHTEEIRVLKGQLDEAVGFIEELQQQVDETTSENEDLSSTLEDAEAMIKKLQQEVGDRNEEIQAIEKELDEVVNVIEDNESEIARLKHQLEGEAGMELIAKEIDDLENQLKQEKIEHDATKAQLEQYKQVENRKKLNLQDGSTSTGMSCATDAIAPAEGAPNTFLQSVMNQLTSNVDMMDDDDETTCMTSLETPGVGSEETMLDGEEEDEYEEDDEDTHASRLFGSKAKGKQPMDDSFGEEEDEDEDEDDWRSRLSLANSDATTQILDLDTLSNGNSTSISCSSSTRTVRTVSTQTDASLMSTRHPVTNSTHKVRGEKLSTVNKPTVSNIRIEGHSMCSEILYPSYKFTGGEDDSIVKWYKSIDGYSFYEITRTLIPPKLYCCADLVHHYVRISILPRNKNGERGTLSYSKLVYINVDPNVDKTLKEMVLCGQVSFNVNVSMSKQKEESLVLRFDSKKVRLCLPSITEEITPDKKKTHILFAAAWADHIQMFTHHNSSDIRFVLRHVVKKKAWRILFSVKEKIDRDIILLAFRTFYCMGRDSVLKYVLPKEGKSDWKKGKWKSMDCTKRAQIISKNLKQPIPTFSKYSQQHRPGSHRTFFHLIEEIAIENEIDRKSQKERKYPFLLD